VGASSSCRFFVGFFVLSSFLGADFLAGRFCSAEGAGADLGHLN